MGILDVSCLDKFSKGVRSLDSEEFRKQAYQTVDFIADYYKNIEKLPVLSRVEPGYLVNQLPKSPPQQPESFDEILKDIQTQIMPGMTHWLSPSFFAYFPATVSTAAYVGEMLCTAFNAVGFNWLASPAATELEMVVMDWLANLLNLPKKFMFSGTGGGVIQGTTSEAMLCTILAARDRALERIGNKNIGRLVVYGSDQTHSTFAKACKIAGILPENIRYIATKADKAFSLSPELVEKTMELDVKKGLVPIYLCITVGTTSSTAVDPLPELAQVAGKFDAWVHVDAAYAGSACICPEYRHLIDGVEMVDSISLSPHKWLLTYLDCCCLWVSNPSLLIKGLSTDPEYLKNKPSESKSVIDYKDWQIGTGRRFRALKLWLVLRSHGVENLQSHIRSDIRMAKVFENLVLTDHRFEVVTARQFGLICFRLKPHILHCRNEDEERKTANEMNEKLIDTLNASGKIYITHTVIDGIYVIRFAVGATLTEDHHVQAAWKLIQETADELLRGN